MTPIPLVGFVLCITAFHLHSTPVRQLLCVSVFTQGKVLTETWGGACLRLSRCLLLIAFSLTLESILLFIIVWCYLYSCYIVPAIRVWLLCLQVNNWQLPLMAARFLNQDFITSSTASSVHMAVFLLVSLVPWAWQGWSRVLEMYPACCESCRRALSLKKPSFQSKFVLYSSGRHYHFILQDFPLTNSWWRICFCIYVALVG